jgi:hypothetical protein
VNKRIVLATARGVIKYYKPSMYETITETLGDSWARSLLIRMGYSKRKGIYIPVLVHCRRPRTNINCVCVTGIFINFPSIIGTKAAKKLPADFVDQKSTYLERIKGIINDYHIPEELIINFDQTGTVCYARGYCHLHSLPPHSSLPRLTFAKVIFSLHAHFLFSLYSAIIQ